MSFRTKFALILASATLALYTLVGGWMVDAGHWPVTFGRASKRKLFVAMDSSFSTSAKNIAADTAAKSAAASVNKRGLLAVPRKKSSPISAPASEHINLL